MKFIIFSIIAISYLSSAQSTLDVKALDASRNCWYTEFKDTKMIQIADFGGFDPKSYRLHKDDLQEQIAEGIKDGLQQNNFNIEMKGKYEAHLFCSSSGHSLIINSFESNPAFIYKVKLDQLDQGEFAFNDQAQKGFSLGSSLHTVIMKRKSYISSENYIKLLKTFFPEAIASARFLRNSETGSIRVLPEFYFKTKEIIESIKAHRVLSHYTQYLELSPYQTFSGESGLLLNGIF